MWLGVILLLDIHQLSIFITAPTQTQLAACDIWKDSNMTTWSQGLVVNMSHCHTRHTIAPSVTVIRMSICQQVKCPGHLNKLSAAVKLNTQGNPTTLLRRAQLRLTNSHMINAQK